ncbi:hypothetical protein LENED_003115 [Lentinula edodes]|uniref:Integral membrane protein n=1 Tax=Lentinula edodes TaxID=5353 RepID=A0A1Q3E332_LENED|nr:hypothetical protein LENED_003115 [Lentinula edodes]
MLANLLYLLAHLNKLGLREAPNTMTITKLGAISCDTWYKIIASLAVLGRAAVIVTFTLRTYVVWAQSRIVLISLVMLGLATVLTDAMYVPRQTCENTRGDTATFDLVRSFLTISFETLSATLILIRSLQAFRRGSYFNQYKLIHFLMQEGAVYFCIVSLFTIATFVLKLSTEVISLDIRYRKRTNHDEKQSKYLHDLLNAFTLPLSGLLTARFLLHLRAWNKARSSATTAIDIDPGQNEPDPDWPASSISSFGIQSVSVTASLNSELTSAWITTAEYGEDPMLKVPVPT